ncbi:hypothetical protein HYU20_00625 [Candidatus Woesearchaeota archaeon]|nr:hypothetical protein [Candidatus Woesearchaeota archaeon]
MGSRRNAGKPKWLEERERTNRPTVTRNGKPQRATQTLEGKVNSEAAEGAASQTTGYDASPQPQIPPGTVRSAAQNTFSTDRRGAHGGDSGGGTITIRHSSFPKWAYVPITLAAAALLYATGTVTNVLPNPSEIIRHFRPVPIVSSPSAGETKQDRQAQPDKRQADILNMVYSELDRLRRYPEIPQMAALVNTIETTLGQDGYSATEASMINTIGPAAEMLALRNIPERIEDLKTILQTGSYRSSTINVGDRNLEIVVLASDSTRAPYYFDALQRIVPKVEGFTGLKYEERTLVVYSQPKKGGGLENIATLGGVITWYPEVDKQVVRRYEVTTEQKALEENIAHEFDHVLSDSLNLPVWLAEGKANFTAYHALRTKNGPPTLEEPFTGYRANLELNVKNSRGTIPPISEQDGPYGNFKGNIGVAGDLGEFLLQDILAQIGQDNMLQVIREVNASPPKKFIDTQSFVGIVLKYTPSNLQPQMNKFINERVYGTQTAQP